MDKIVTCLLVFLGWKHYIQSVVEGDDTFPTLRANHRKLQNDKQSITNMTMITAWNEMYGATKKTIAIVALCHIFNCAKAPSCTTKLHLCTMSCLNSMPSKALSCVIRTPSPMPNKAAKKSIYRVPRNPLDMLNIANLKFSRSNISTTAWAKAPKETIDVMDVRPDVRRPAAREHIPSKAPYAAIAIPTPETPIAGVTTYLVNSAHTNACCRPEYAIRGMINNIFTSDNASNQEHKILCQNQRKSYKTQRSRKNIDSDLESKTSKAKAKFNFKY
ncbi:uncharacterized protein LOC127130157 [Lathyrus oleraceus]|uniref:uncharacterized protein LOC127130157 n=1 Tax=Pisum sativum TaxID=3888 RepID=UPI0021D1A2DA|nr:uncharacterized protein LOC127130157 [Pisum sativum]